MNNEARTGDKTMHGIVRDHIADLRRCVPVLRVYGEGAFDITATEFAKAADELEAALSLPAAQDGGLRDAVEGLPRFRPYRQRQVGVPDGWIAGMCSDGEDGCRWIRLSDVRELLKLRERRAATPAKEADPYDDYFKYEFRELERAVTALGVVLHFRDDGGFARAELPTPNAIRGDNTEHPETRCDQCGGANPAPWFAPNEDWNRIVGSESGMLCPTCFLIRAREKGEDGIWQFAPDNAIRGDKVEVANLFWDRLFGAKIQLVLDVDSEDDNFLPLVVGFGSSEGGDSMLLHAEVDGKPVSLAIRGDKGAEAVAYRLVRDGATDPASLDCWQDGAPSAYMQEYAAKEGMRIDYAYAAPTQAAAKDTP